MDAMTSKGGGRDTRCDAIRRKALGVGFDAIGFARPQVSAQARRGLSAFLAAGCHGDMGWLEQRAAQRGDPQKLWPQARSVIVLGARYAPAFDPLAATRNKNIAAISVYARSNDYHATLRRRLKNLALWLARRYRAQSKVCVDTSPVMEKHLAAQAGLGWQGKHTNLVSRRFGSWLFLGEVFIDLELAPSSSSFDGKDSLRRGSCGSCRACLDICPTRAFPAPYRLDARRCISYLTIEHRGMIPLEFRKAIGNRVFGCDDCLAVCPWNKFAAAARARFLAPYGDRRLPSLRALLALDEGAFRRRFAGTAIVRTGWKRFLRNVLIAVGNSGDKTLIASVVSLLRDDSVLVRATAVWALAELMEGADFRVLRARYLAHESDPQARAEWHR